MSSSNRIPFQDITNEQSQDPKEVKRRRDRERYAQNKEQISKRRRELRELKKQSIGHVRDENNFCHTQSIRQSVITQSQTTGDNIPAYVLKRVKQYLESDMVFIPINQGNVHWYLAVINARKQCIQVLDSLGRKIHRKDLDDTLQGLENVFKFASPHMELKSDKWKNLNITTWTREDCIEESLQKDGSSCGLWMLNFMEYFTGDELSDVPSQDNITDFRSKLPVILVDSELNDDTVRNRDLKDDDDDQRCDPTDCFIVDGPPKTMKTSKLSSEIGFISQSLLLSPSVKPTQQQLIDELCLYISTVDDVFSLEREWVRSSNPYPISLDLRQLRNILKINEKMDASCFNMAVRILASDGVRFARDIPVHYMDLEFCFMSYNERDQSRHETLDVARWAQLFDSWPDSNEYNISQCRMILLPWDLLGLFQLFILDPNKKEVSILDQLPIPLMGKNIFHSIVQNLNLALQHANPEFKDDISKWRCRVPYVRTHSRALSGYLVFNLMHSWDEGNLVYPIPRDESQLRRRFLVHVLKCEGNEARNNIPAMARSIIDRIQRWTFLKKT